MEPEMFQHPRTLFPCQLLAFCRDSKFNSKTEQKNPIKKLTKRKTWYRKTIHTRVVKNEQKMGF